MDQVDGSSRDDLTGAWRLLFGSRCRGVVASGSGAKRRIGILSSSVPYILFGLVVIFDVPAYSAETKNGDNFFYSQAPCFYNPLFIQITTKRNPLRSLN